jgi:hypothetical protein
MCKETAMPKISNIVLVHGGFVDGAGWRGVYDILKKEGFNVSIVQNPTISLAGDVSAALQIPAVIGDKVAQSSVGGRVGQQRGFP